tara:strand:- start:348 stop:512 length:165 start_codon:yes stop_codon:yes gene_type:complete
VVASFLSLIKYFFNNSPINEIENKNKLKKKTDLKSTSNLIKKINEKLIVKTIKK